MWGILDSNNRDNARVSQYLDSDRVTPDENSQRIIRMRSCQPDDLKTVGQLLEKETLSGDGLEDQFGEAYVLAECSGDVVGCAGVEVHGSHGLLRSVVVISERRREGIGETLVTDRLEWARSRGMSTVYLLTETATGYFERFGFKKVKRTDVPPEIRASSEFSVMCPETADVMVRRL
jgi:amino-acid N-acetyltransferase